MVSVRLLLAMLHIKSNPKFKFNSGFINDIANSWPTIMAFKPQFEQGALLTIVLSLFSFETKIFILLNLFY